MRKKSQSTHLKVSKLLRHGAGNLTLSTGNITAAHTELLCPFMAEQKLWWFYFLLKCEGNSHAKKHLTREVEFQYKSNYPIFQKNSTVRWLGTVARALVWHPTLSPAKNPYKINKKTLQITLPPPHKKIPTTTTYVQSCENQVILPIQNHSMALSQPHRTQL